MDLFELALAKKLAGGGGGGGGDSDFSTATVTLTNSTGDVLEVFGLPYLETMEGLSFVGGLMGDQLDNGASVQVQVPLYKGGCLWMASLLTIYEDKTFTCSGNITELFQGAILINGDGTITIS